MTLPLAAPLEQRTMSQAKSFQVFGQTVPAIIPASIGRATTAIEPCILKYAVTDFRTTWLCARIPDNGRSS